MHHFHMIIETLTMVLLFPHFMQMKSTQHNMAYLIMVAQVPPPTIPQPADLNAVTT